MSFNTDISHMYEPSISVDSYGRISPNPWYRPIKFTKPKIEYKPNLEIPEWIKEKMQPYIVFGFCLLVVAVFIFI
jgi:hypothetical protein